jgi:hypothetical protein
VRLKTDKFPSMFPSVSPGSDFRCSIGPFSPELVILKEVKDLLVYNGLARFRPLLSAEVQADPKPATNESTSNFTPMA